MAKGVLREYAKFAPTFWTGPTGKRLRACGRDAQVLACYLFTAPSSTMMGLYYLPLPTLCHEAGFSIDEARATLAILEELEFAYYDHEAELVWVVEAARYQVADELKATDHRVTGIVRELESFAGHPYARGFYERYKDAFSLPAIIFKKALPRPFTAPGQAGKPLQSQKQKQKQEKEQKQKQKQETAPAAAAAPVRPDLVKAIAGAVEQLAGALTKSWSAEACDAWAQHLGQPPGDRIGHALKPLERSCGWDEVRPVWSWACERAAASDNPDRFTPETFARSYVAFVKRYQSEQAGMPARASPSPRAQARREAADAMIQGGLRGDGTWPSDGRGVGEGNGLAGGESSGPRDGPADADGTRPRLPGAPGPPRR